MKVIVIVGILIAAVIGGVAVLSSMPSETLQDNRPDLRGVTHPDENKEKIDCLSRGGVWDYGCSINSKTEHQNEIGITCMGNEACLTLNVDRIVDGDTIYAGSYKIRLSLVDTPEKDELGFQQATSFTAMSCPIGSRIIVDQDDGQPYDNYDRLLGMVHCETGNLNEMLLQNGHAEILPQYCFRSEFTAMPWAQEYGCTKPDFSKVEPEECDPSYPDFCIAPGHADLDCGEISERNFRVLQPDPHRFDGDKDGIGCES